MVNLCLYSCVTAQLRGNTNHTMGVVLRSSACANMIVAGDVAIVDPPFGREQNFAGTFGTLMGRDSTGEEGHVVDRHGARSTRKISRRGDSGSTRYLPVRLVPALCRLHFNPRRTRCGAHTSTGRQQASDCACSTTTNAAARCIRPSRSIPSLPTTVWTRILDPPPRLPGV